MGSGRKLFKKHFKHTCFKHTFSELNYTKVTVRENWGRKPTQRKQHILQTNLIMNAVFLNNIILFHPTSKKKNFAPV